MKYSTFVRLLASLSALIFAFCSCDAGTEKYFPEVANGGEYTCYPAAIATFTAECAEAATFSKELSAQCYCLMDSATGEILVASREHEKHPIASTTKLMTALVAVENASLSEMVKVDPRAVGVEGSSVYLYAGEEMSLHHLLYALLLESANDAAEAIAYAVCGSVEAFAVLMNEKAAALGMKNTSFKNPHGLQVDGHYSSAYDMALLTAAAMKDETIATISATKNCRVPVFSKNGEYRYLSNHNKLLSLYSSCIGGKTGYTRAAGRCLASASRRDGKTLVAMTINAHDDWNDHVSLYEYGFSIYSQKTLCKQRELSIEIPVVGGEEGHTTATNLEEITVPIKAGDEITSKVILPRFLYAPVYGIAGLPPDAYATYAMHPVGKIEFFVNGCYLSELPLYILDSVPILYKPTSWEKILGFFGLNEKSAS